VRKFASSAAATLALAAACWGAWRYAPDLLAALGLDDLDIPGRVGAVFLFLTGVEGAIERLRKK
jgi:hypothetical protein